MVRLVTSLPSEPIQHPRLSLLSVPVRMVSEVDILGSRDPTRSPRCVQLGKRTRLDDLQVVNEVVFPTI
jgi:hypothetical protein